MKMFYWVRTSVEVVGEVWRYWEGIWRGSGVEKEEADEE